MNDKPYILPLKTNLVIFYLILFSFFGNSEWGERKDAPKPLRGVPVVTERGDPPQTVSKV
jgi:hypothetical protein